MNLRCTISGGCEDLAKQELHEAFPTAHLTWTQKGHSGSQLCLELPSSSSSSSSSSLPVDFGSIVQTVQSLRFVEYMYYVVHTQEYSICSDDNLINGQQKQIQIEIQHPHQQLLSEIQSNIALDPTQFQMAMSIGRSLQIALQDRSVGLEPLPGELLPTPVIPVEMQDDIDDCTSTGTHLNMTTTTTAFQVNTIYTKSKVAKAVVDIFVEKVQQHLDMTTTSTSSSHPNPILWLDAGAGAGALLQHLPPSCRLGVDIAPSLHPEIRQADFLKITLDFLLQQQHNPSAANKHTLLCVISNPPFAEGSRGDYTSIIRFLNHSIRVLKARFVGVIVPAKFARPRIWASLGMDHRARLLVRFFLPQNSFVDPAKQQSVHIHCYFLLFGVDSPLGLPSTSDSESSSWSIPPPPPPSMMIPSPKKLADSFYLHGKRDKSDFSYMTTLDLVQATAKALSTHPTYPLLLTSEQTAEFPLWVKLQKKTTNNRAQMELWLLLNPERPLSLSNSVSCRISQHSLGWMSLSVKPPVAYAMLQSVTTENSSSSNGGFFVNAMLGEGTIELEAHANGLQQQQQRPFFLLSGDKNEWIVTKTAQRLRELQQQCLQPSTTKCQVDLVIWDAQRLPIRDNVVDLFLADLPFAGSQKQTHQIPTCNHHQEQQKQQGRQDNKHEMEISSSTRVDSALSYRRIMTQAVRIMKPHSGHAALISADTKALIHSTSNLHWQPIPHKSIHRMNLGGLNAQLLVLKKAEPCYKDLSVWVKGNTSDLSPQLEQHIQATLEGWYLDDMLKLQQQNNGGGSMGPSQQHLLVQSVTLVDKYHHEQSQRHSHCYRITLNSQLTNLQSKEIEKCIRASIQSSPLYGITGIR